MTRLEVSLSSYDGIVPLNNTPYTVGWYTIAHVGAPTFTVQGPHGLTPGLFAIPNHGMAGNTPVVISAISGTTAFTVGTTYYVDDSGVTDPANTFFLSAAPGSGIAIVPTDNNGAGVMFTPNTNATHTIYMQPQRYGESWTVTRVIIQNTSQIKVPTCSIYRGVVALSSLIDTTANGIFNSDDLNSALTVNQGEPIIIQWTGCDPPTASSPVQSTAYLYGDTNR